jgi:3-oxoacyl-[acyl-carrier protein] reductase
MPEPPRFREFRTAAVRSRHSSHGPSISAEADSISRDAAILSLDQLEVGVDGAQHALERFISPTYLRPIVRQLYNYRRDVFGGWKVMNRLSGKTAVVTGASKGIGAGIAKGLAAEGAAVVVNYASSMDGADRVVADIRAKGGKAIAVQGDVAKAADVEKIFAETKKAFGRLDILVNNAGVYKLLPLEEVTEEDFHRHFNVNVLGLILATKEAAKLFGGEGGSVINIGSVVSDLNPPNSVVYTATKGAVDAVTRVLAKELGPRKIRVNSINPGLIETEGTHAMGVIGHDPEKQFVALTPLGRTGQPDDIAPVAVFLASDESRWVTGDTLAVSGGLR